MPKKKPEPLTEADWLAWMESKLVRLQPVLGPKNVVDWWSAGFTRVSRSGQNVVNTSASGLTAMDALQALYRGEYHVKDGVLLREPGKLVHTGRHE